MYVQKEGDKSFQHPTPFLVKVALAIKHRQQGLVMSRVYYNDHISFCRAHRRTNVLMNSLNTAPLWRLLDFGRLWDSESLPEAKGGARWCPKTDTQMHPQKVIGDKEKYEKIYPNTFSF